MLVDLLVIRGRTAYVLRPVDRSIRGIMSGGLTALATLVALTPEMHLALRVALSAVCATGAAALWNAAVFLSANEESVRLGLSPLRFAGFPTSEVDRIEAVSVEPLAKEWGNRGHPTSASGLFLDVGFSRYAIRIDLRDGRSYSIGTGDSEADVAELRARLGLKEVD